MKLKINKILKKF